MRQPTIRLEKAHDVRELRSCSKCANLGDRRYMPKVNGEYLHGFCALDALGVEGLVKLPRGELGKITIGEIGAAAMKKLCDRMSEIDDAPKQGAACP